MYNAHRPGIGPGPNPPNNRLAELLDQVRQEFDNQAGRAGDYEQQRKFAPTMRQVLSLSVARCGCALRVAVLCHHTRLVSFGCELYAQDVCFFIVVSFLGACFRPLMLPSAAWHGTRLTTFCKI
jgi:hypothetical protein